jgi:FkbM family methyltransferase
MHLVGGYAGDFRTAGNLLRCYGHLLRPGTPDRDVDLLLRIGRRRAPLRMRASDIFTLAEILHEGQYDVQSRLPPSPVIIDAGANIGVTATWFLGRCPGARLHCFEPSSANFAYLLANVGTAPGARVTRAALGAESGMATLRLAEHGAMHSTSGGDTALGTESVPCIALADYLATAAVPTVDLLKLDVEGSELEVLRGLRDRLADVRVIIGEVHESLVDPGAFYGYLADHGFSVLWRRYFEGGERDRVHGFEAARILIGSTA